MIHIISLAVQRYGDWICVETCFYLRHLRKNASDEKSVVGLYMISRLSTFETTRFSHGFPVILESH